MLAMLCALWALLPSGLRAADALPPPPAKYFNDYAGLVSAQTANNLNGMLEDFERRTSNQVVVAIFPKVPDGYVMEDFTQRTFQAWGVGQKKTNNGVVLFVFPQSRKMRIEVGYGLEGALPDITAKQILDNEITPAFRAKNFDLGLANGVSAIMKATQGEYTGSGSTTAERNGANPSSETPGLVHINSIPAAIGAALLGIVASTGSWGFFIIIFILAFIFRNHKGTTYRSRWGSGSSWYIGSSSGGGSSSSGSSGGFSGGGGSSGGGGASGGW